MYVRVLPVSVHRSRRGRAVQGIGQTYTDMFDWDAFTADIEHQASESQALEQGEREMYPWNTYSSYTLTLQRKINAEFEAKGSVCRVEEDGKLGPLTCGAARVTGFAAPRSCREYATSCPQVEAQIAAQEGREPEPVQTVEAPPPAPEPTPAPTTEKKLSTASMLAAGGILAVLVVGGYAYAKHKGLIA